jgi:hypothetical protein
MCKIVVVPESPLNVHFYSNFTVPLQNFYDSRRGFEYAPHSLSHDYEWVATGSAVMISLSMLCWLRATYTVQTVSEGSMDVERRAS